MKTINIILLLILATAAGLFVWKMQKGAPTTVNKTQAPPPAAEKIIAPAPAAMPKQSAPLIIYKPAPRVRLGISTTVKKAIQAPAGR